MSIIILKENIKMQNNIGYLNYNHNTQTIRRHNCGRTNNFFGAWQSSDETPKVEVIVNRESAVFCLFLK